MLRREPLPATAVERTSTVRPLLAPAAWAPTCGCGVGTGTTSPSLRNSSRPLFASQCRAHRPTAPARSPKGSPVDIQCAVQSPASDAAHHTSDRSLPAADTAALEASPGTKTAPALFPVPAAAPSPTQSPESAPTAPAARDETPPPCPAGS